MDGLKFVIQDEALIGTKIKVIGVGGGGSNAVARMMSEGLAGVEFHIMNTDAQALSASTVPNKLAIGSKVTSGLGAGADPAVGRQAALEETERIIEILEGADMVFITAGLGGGTGTGAAPVVASLAKELGALAVAVVTKPFGFEGPRRLKQAERGLAELAASVDTVIAVPNDKLLKLVPKGTSFFEAFRTADDILRQAVQGISDIITTPGVINRDFSDIRAIMLGMGHAMMGTATAAGESASANAAREAINCPLMDDHGIKGARGVLINITGSSRLSLHDVNEACSLIREATANEDAQINFGVVYNESMEDRVKITVIATGFQREVPPELRPAETARVATAVAGATSMTGQPEVPPRLFPEMPFTAETPAPQVYATAVPAPERSVPGITPEPVMEIVREEPAAEPAATRSADSYDESAMPLDDLDVPAFLKRDRRLYQ